MSSSPSWYQPPAADPAPSLPGRVSVIAALRFALSGRGWLRNTGFALLLMFVPIVGPIAFMGWQCEMMQRLVRRHPDPRVDFDFNDAVPYFMRGLVPFVIGFVFQLPFFLVLYGFILVMALSGGLLAEQNEAAAIGAMAGVGLVGFVFWSYGVAVVNAAHTRAELTEDFGAGFDLGSVFRYANKTWLKHLGVLMVFIPIAVGLSLLGMLVLFVGVYFVAPVLQMAAMHLRWQLYEWTQTRGGPAIPLKEPQWLPSEVQKYWQRQAQAPGA